METLGIERLRQHVASLFYEAPGEGKAAGHVQKFIFLAMARFDRKKLTTVNCSLDAISRSRN
jgi:hypothetical protein